MSQSRSASGDKIRKLVGTALLLAFVVVLQLIGTFIKIGPIPMSLVLIPIVVGACLHGSGSGAFLGFAFGVVVSTGAITGSDGFSFVLFQANPFWTVLAILLKGTLAGWVAGFIFSLIRKKSIFWASVSAAVVCPVLNTGIFCLAMLTVLRDSLISFAGESPLVEFTLLSLAGVNFIGELLTTVIIVPVLVKVLLSGLHKTGGKL